MSEQMIIDVDTWAVCITYCIFSIDGHLNPPDLRYSRACFRLGHDALLNNTHLGGETTVDVIQEGARAVSEAAKQLDLEVISTSAEERFQNELGEKDIMENPARYLRRFMPQTFC